jgi:hypothetical protein
MRSFITNTLCPVELQKIKSRSMKWAGRVAQRRRRINVRIWWESQRERDH